jgi:type II secretory pathway pseudopilin PulG
MRNHSTHLEPSSQSPRGGTTLLEVLVACGILVIGLASVAALLPAAASVMADAARLDRAANLATNAVADLRFRGLLTAASFNDQVKTLVFGEMFPDAPFGSNPFRKEAVPPTPLDEQAYGTAWFGATVAPLAPDGDVKKGMPAKATVVVFRNQNPDAKQIPLTRVSPGIYRLADGTAIQREADRKRFLPGCAWVAVVRNDTVRWLHVGNSWATYSKPGQTQDLKQITHCYVSFSDAAAAAAVTQGNTLTVHGFSGVLKLEEHLVSLE